MRGVKEISNLVDVNIKGATTYFAVRASKGLIVINALFVDDNRELLESVQRNFFSRRNRLNLMVATSIDEALRIAASQPIDVVMSNMSLSGEKGTELLRRVKQQLHGAVRVVISDHDDKEDSMESTSVAHRLMTKPSDTDAIADVIFLSCEWRDRIKDAALAELLTDMPSFASDPGVMREFRETLKGETTAAQLAGIARRDPALTQKLLQLQGSSFFGPGRNSLDLTMAISFLRFDTLRELLETPEFTHTDDSLQPAVADVVQSVRKRCVASAERTYQRAIDRGVQPREADEAWVVGLLSGLGAMTIAELAPEKLGDGDFKRHGAATAYVARLWGLPSLCCEQLEAFADGRPMTVSLALAS